MIVAKPVIPNQFWILKQNDRKVGNIEASAEGFSVKIGDQVNSYKTINTIKQKIAIAFEPGVKNINAGTKENIVHGFPTCGHAYNAIYDVKHQVPLWTREPRSKSWYSAGWYRVKQGRKWTVEFCPKLITLQRYQYQGPFYTEEQANEQRV
jgi:hypothetical protein